MKKTITILVLIISLNCFGQNGSSLLYPTGDSSTAIGNVVGDLIELPYHFGTYLQDSDSLFRFYTTQSGISAITKNSIISCVDGDGNSIDYDLTNDIIYINGNTDKILKYTMKQIGCFLNQIDSLQSKNKKQK